MFILILVLILVLPGAFLPMALKSSFSSEELLEMGVYLEESLSIPICLPDQVNNSQISPLYSCVGLST